VIEAAAGLGGSARQFFDDAPCGWVYTGLGGQITRSNLAFRSWTGYSEEQLSGGRRIQDLLAPGGRIYYQTNLEPLLRMQGSVSQVALEIERADGSRMPALVNAVLRSDDEGDPEAISIMVFDAEHREHEVAEALQRGMVGGTLPTASSFSIKVTYLPSVRSLQIGGDWYDSFWLDDQQQTLALVVGDVVGRGLHAATTMGQLRNAVRTLAMSCDGPAAVLEGLDLYSRRYEVGQGATVLYAQLDLATLVMRFSCAGHPPPAIVRPDGEPQLDWSGRWTPIDNHRGDGRSRPEGSLQLSPGSTLLLYTDGLIERRTHPDEDGLQRLLDTIGDVRKRTTGAAIGPAAVRALHDPGQDDDVCMLAFELTGEVETPA
jgi:PAS domain S-box-containing protein